MPNVQIGIDIGIKGAKKIAVRNKFIVLDIKFDIAGVPFSYIL